MESWGWRLPFLFGLLIGPVAYYIRRHTDETIEFRSTSTSEAPLREALLDSKTRLLIAFGAVVLSTVAMYTVLFMPTYATRQLGLPASGSFIAGLLTGTIQMLLIPLLGAWSDRLGRSRSRLPPPPLSWSRSIRCSRGWRRRRPCRPC